MTFTCVKSSSVTHSQNVIKQQMFHVQRVEIDDLDIKWYKNLQFQIITLHAFFTDGTLNRGPPLRWLNGPHPGQSLSFNSLSYLLSTPQMACTPYSVVGLLHTRSLGPVQCRCETSTEACLIVAYKLYSRELNFGPRAGLSLSNGEFRASNSVSILDVDGTTGQFSCSRLCWR